MKCQRYFVIIVSITKNKNPTFFPGTVHIPLQPTKESFFGKQHRSNKKLKANGMDDTFATENS